MGESSFCKQVCELINASVMEGYGVSTIQICRGCGRTAAEVEEWFTASSERKVEIARVSRKRMNRNIN